ncbi:hypothetical protein EU527_02680 [Candidatus Thorarchaeota archaeon]|nr:MAG: hypothetical protein EU527_02680 [Candidatus Thorarchaeota archaeon]
MRIKAVLRDTDILKMEQASRGRILAAAKKNIDRVISWSSLLKVMGLTFENRTAMLDALKDTKMHVWLMKEGDQHLVFLTETDIEPPEKQAYQWQ